MPRNVDLGRLNVFLAVAQAGGFTAAARRLGATKAMVSQQIGRLERELGASLFNRTTRRVALTDAGQQLYERAQPLLRDLSAVIDQVGEHDRALSGKLRVTCSDHYVQARLAKQLAAFAQRHPQLAVDLLISDEVLDLGAEGIDLAIRTGWLRDSTLHAVRLQEVRQCVIASPALVAQWGMPDAPGELERYPWVALTRLRSPLRWQFRKGNRMQAVRLASRFHTNSTQAVLALVKAGAGAGVLADFMVEDALARGEVVRLLDDWALPLAGVHAVYPATAHVSTRVRALIDFLRDGANARP